MKLQKSQSKSHIKKLQTLISEFTGISRIIFTVKNRANDITAGMFPVYKSDFISDTKISFENAHRYIDRVYIIFGKDTLKKFHHRELTAILLHEIGHIYQHTTNLSFRFSRIFSDASFITTPILIFLRATKIIPFLFIVSRSVFMRDHAIENAADDFATKHGYGEESIRIMSMLGAKRLDEPMLIEKVLDVLKNIVLPTRHPSYKTRICKTIDAMIKEYSNMYPEISDDIKMILSDFKCKGYVS
jgi:Zn-dependent protease with chaperone function